MNSEQKFFTVVKQYEALIDQIQATKEELNAVMADIGVGKMVQDPSDMTVYQIQTPIGRFVHFDTISYIRTRKVGEDRGDLSLKKAEEAGFSLPHLKK